MANRVMRDLPPNPASLKDRLTLLFPEARCTDENGVAGLPAWKGAYALALFLPETMVVPHGKGSVAFDPGWLVYAGSANGAGGVTARLRRHFRREKKPHWHVDRLTVVTPPRFALAIRDGRECAIVSRLAQTGAFDFPVRGFGSSDCRNCPSHLLRLRPLRP